MKVSVNLYNFSTILREKGEKAWNNGRNGEQGLVLLWQRWVQQSV